MSRDYPRVNDPALAHFLTFSCHRKLPLFKYEFLCNLFVERLSTAREKHKFELWAFVIMPTHVHLVVWPKDVPVDLILQSVKRPTAYHGLNYLRKNHRTIMADLHVARGTRSHERFWLHGGGHDFPLYSPEHVLTKIEYIHNNPVRAELSKLPEDWKWSSARFWVTGEPVPLAMDTPPFHFRG